MNDMRFAERAVENTEPKITARGVQVFYGDTHALKDVDVNIADKMVTAFIGPSGCGKSTFLRCLNRMNDTIATARVTGGSGGQQQRLCIARAVATAPEILLMDEPCSALDPIATAQVEELIDELRQNYSVVIVTHSMQQAARVSQRTAFFHLGHLVEYGETGKIFTSPEDPRTESYISGRIG